MQKYYLRQTPVEYSCGDLDSGTVLFNTILWNIFSIVNIWYIYECEKYF